MNDRLRAKSRQDQIRRDHSLALQENRRIIEEDKEFQQQQEENSLPECNICYDKIQHNDITVLECGHIFHPQCMKHFIEAELDRKGFPLI